MANINDNKDNNNQQDNLITNQELSFSKGNQNEDRGIVFGDTPTGGQTNGATKPQPQGTKDVKTGQTDSSTVSGSSTGTKEQKTPEQIQKEQNDANTEYNNKLIEQARKDFERLERERLEKEKQALWKEAKDSAEYAQYLKENELTDKFGDENGWKTWDNSIYWDFKQYGKELKLDDNNKVDLNYQGIEEDLAAKQIKIEPLEVDENLDFILPQYGVQDFINERALWQKGTYNLLGEPGWFYFKIFFKFNDFKGLFGGILDNKLPKTSALRYLAGIRDHYRNDKIYDRMLALARFTFTLSYINSQSPWFFSGLSGVNMLNAVEMSEFTKEKNIDIICNNDAIDMRLNTLLDMYRKACYDEINQKEIIPENLRKFDMSIVFMNIPIRYLQTAIILSGKNNALSHFTNDKNINKAIDKINNVTSFLTGNTDITTFDYKTIQGGGSGGASPVNRLSFQMYTLRNCEINLETFKNYLPSSASNTEFFKLGGGAIKINYDRCFKHTFNEWNQMMYGTDSFIYDQSDNYINPNNLTSLIDHSRYSDINLVNAVNDQNRRINGIKNSIYNSFFNKDATAYKSLIDFSETIIKDSMINSKNDAFLGNIYDIENTDRNDWSATWKRTKDKIKNFFTDGW